MTASVPESHLFCISGYLLLTMEIIFSISDNSFQYRNEVAFPVPVASGGTGAFHSYG